MSNIPESWKENWRALARRGNAFAIDWCKEHRIAFRDECDEPEPTGAGTDAAPVLEEDEYDKFIREYRKENP